MKHPDNIDALFADTDALVQAVHTELLELRGAYGKLTLQKFSQFPVLRAVSGGNDLTDDFLVFKRELDRLLEEANRDEAAAAYSITAPADGMTDRLEHVVARFPDSKGRVRDERTARRWSDRGMRNVAVDMVRLATLSGWMGRETLNIELSGPPDQFFLSIWYGFSDGLRARTPQLNILDFSREDGPKDEPVNLEAFMTAETQYEGSRAQQYHVQIALPENLTHPEITGTETVVTLVIDTAWAPMRTMTFVDRSDMGPNLRAVFTAYRGLIMIHLIHGEPKTHALAEEMAEPYD